MGKRSRNLSHSGRPYIRNIRVFGTRCIVFFPFSLLSLRLSFFLVSFLAWSAKQNALARDDAHAPDRCCSFEVSYWVRTYILSDMYAQSIYPIRMRNCRLLENKVPDVFPSFFFHFPTDPLRVSRFELPIVGNGEKNREREARTFITGCVDSIEESLRALFAKKNFRIRSDRTLGSSTRCPWHEN